jgi:hypothetical protein
MKSSFQSRLTFTLLILPMRRSSSVYRAQDLKDSHSDQILVTESRIIVIASPFSVIEGTERFLNLWVLFVTSNVATTEYCSTNLTCLADRWSWTHRPSCCLLNTNHDLVRAVGLRYSRVTNLQHGCR